MYLTKNNKVQMIKLVVDNMNYSLPLSADGTRGGVQIGYSENGKNYPVETEVKVSNVAGAGDTFLAGLVFKYIGEYDIDNAIYWGNQYASKVVQERGVTTI